MKPSAGAFVVGDKTNKHFIASRSDGGRYGISAVNPKQRMLRTIAIMDLPQNGCI